MSVPLLDPLELPGVRYPYCFILPILISRYLRMQSIAVSSTYASSWFLQFYDMQMAIFIDRVVHPVQCRDEEEQ